MRQYNAVPHPVFQLHSGSAAGWLRFRRLSPRQDPGSHLPLAEIRSELAEKAVFHAAAQHMDHRIMRPGASLQIFQRPAVFQRQALINAAENGTRRFRDMLSGFAAVRLNTLRNISGRCENRVVRVDITGRLVHCLAMVSISAKL